jgi:autotransporter-associated beta strand protein
MENNYSVAALTFNSTIGASFNVTGTTGKNLAVGAGGITNASAYDQTISTGIAQDTTPLVVYTGTKQVTLSGDVEGSGGYTVNGSGTLYLNNTANGIGGPVVVNNGATLRLADDTDFGDNGYAYSDSLTLDGGTLRNDDADTTHGDSIFYWANPCTLGAGGGTFNIPNAGALLYGDGTSFRGTTWHAGTPLTGVGKLTKTGIGTLIMTNSNPNTYEGGTFVKAGTLVVKKDGNLGTGDVTVASGATFELTAPTQLPSSPTVYLILQSGTPTVKLSYSGTANITGLSFDGGATWAAGGSWGSSTSGADHTSALFSGTGTVTVPVSVAPVTSMTLTNGPGSNLTLSYSGGLGAQFVLLRTNLLAAPLANWARIQTNFSTPSTFTLTPGSDPVEFYRVKSE